MMELLVALVGIIPTTATAVSTVYMNSARKKDRDEARRLAEMHASKSSIQQMITQDIIRAEILGRLPENKDNIEHEYDNYHRNGGNGTITRQFNEYKDWYSEKERSFKSKVICQDGVCKAPKQ